MLLRQFSLLLPLLVAPIALVGCGGPNRPYDILETTRGSAQITVYAEAPRGATETELRTWAADIENIRGDIKEPKRPVMINFYNGGRGAQNMIATYSSQTKSLYQFKKTR